MMRTTHCCGTLYAVSMVVSIALLSSVAGADADLASLLHEADRLYAVRDDTQNLTAATELYASAMNTERATDEVRFHCLVRLIGLYDFKGRFLVPDSSDKYEAFRACEEYARQLIDLEPDSPEGYYRLAVALGRQAQVRGILKSLFIAKPFKDNLEKSLEKDPSYVNALMVLSRLYLEAPRWPLSVGDPRKAREYAEKAFSLDPDHPGVVVQMARIIGRQGERDKAIALLNRVINAEVPQEHRLDVLEDKLDALELLEEYLN